MEGVEDRLKYCGMACDDVEFVEKIFQEIYTSQIESDSQ